jgi:hypothetical protein
VLFGAASCAASNRQALERLHAYLERSQGDDADRIEAARGSRAFLRALGERRTWVPTGRPARVELKLHPLGRGGALGGHVVEATIGEARTVRLLLDSGSTGLFLVERVAKRCGFEEIAQETTFGGGGDERHRSRRGILPSLALGALRFEGAVATVSRREIDAQGRYQGIVGVHLFDGYRVTLDLPGNRLVLEPPQPDPQGLPYWNVAGQLVVMAGPDPGPKGLFVVDTGATESLVDGSFAALCPDARLGGTREVRGYGGSLRGARTVAGVRLVLDGTVSRTDRLGVADLSLRSRLSGVEIAGFVGLDVLQDRRVVLDTVARRVRLSIPWR